MVLDPCLPDGNCELKSVRSSLLHRRSYNSKTYSRIPKYSTSTRVSELHICKPLASRCNKNPSYSRGARNSSSSDTVAQSFRPSWRGLVIGVYLGTVAMAIVEEKCPIQLEPMPQLIEVGVLSSHYFLAFCSQVDNVSGKRWR